jgi:hypothetical protein
MPLSDRANGIQGAIETFLLLPDSAHEYDLACRQIRQMYGADVTDDEIDMAARRVLAQWRARTFPAARARLATIEANWRAITERRDRAR